MNFIQTGLTRAMQTSTNNRERQTDMKQTAPFSRHLSAVVSLHSLIQYDTLNEFCLFVSCSVKEYHLALLCLALHTGIYIADDDYWKKQWLPILFF